jgi:hypothetical protein
MTMGEVETFSNNLIIITVIVVVFLCAWLRIDITWYAWVGIGMLLAYAVVTRTFTSHSGEMIKLAEKKSRLENEKLEAQIERLRRK